GGDAHVERDDAADPDGERLLEHHHAPRVRERLADLVERPGAEGLDAERADAHALVAQLVDRVLDRAEHGPEGHHDGLRVLDPVAADEPARLAAERPREVLPTWGIRSSACIC